MRCDGTLREGGFYYVVSEAPEALVPAVERAYFRREGDRFVKWYPADMPEQARMAATFARLGPGAFASAGARWREALARLCVLASGEGIALTLVGSAAAALQGADVAPGDLDVLVSPEEFARLDGLLRDMVVEPLLDYGDALLLVRYFGRLCIEDTWVDLSAGPKPAFAIGETISWRIDGMELRVQSLAAWREGK